MLAFEGRSEIPDFAAKLKGQAAELVEYVELMYSCAWVVSLDCVKVLEEEKEAEVALLTFELDACDPQH